MSWEEWAAWFRALFGLGDWFEPTTRVWVRDVFVPSGITPDELRDAALSLAKSAPPKPSELLAALHGELKRAAAERFMDVLEQERTGGLDVTAPVCRDCDGTGWVSVPHCPQPSWAAEKDVLATCAVRCSCHLGGRFGGKSATALQLTLYERDNPDWRDEMAWWRRRARAEVLAAGETSWFGKLANRWLKQAAEKRKRGRG